MPTFNVKGRLFPNADLHAESVEFEVQAESLDMFVEHLLCLGASIQSSGFENIRNAVVIVERAGWSFSLDR